MGSLSPNPNAWSGLLSTWSVSTQLREYRSTQLNSTQLETPFNSTPLNCNPPIWQIVAGLQVDCMVNWPMRQGCLRLGFAEFLHGICVHSRDMSFIVCRHHLCSCAGSISKRWVSIGTRYGAVQTNIQEPGFKTVCHNMVKPRRPVLPSCLGVPVAVIQGSHVDAPLPQLPPLLPARPSSAWCLSHHGRCFPRPFPAALYELPLLGRTSKRLSHWPVDRQRHWFKYWNIRNNAASFGIRLLPSRDPGTFPGHTWWPARSTATSSAHHGVRGAKSRMRWKSTLILQLTVRPPWLSPLVLISSFRESRTCHTQLGLSDNQIQSIPTWGYDTSIEPPHAFNTCWICWPPESAQMVHPVAPWILRILATKYKPSPL